MKKLIMALCVFAGAACAPRSEPAGDAVMEHDVHIFAPAAHYTIATRILRPAGAGPFPAVIVNHGAGVTAQSRRAESPEMLRHAALQFVQRGYAVLLPLRSGFGATGGVLREHAGSCEDPDYLRGTAAGAADVLAVYDYAQRLPYVDPERMLLAGQSAGGVLALAAAARAPHGLVAVLAFAAGMGGDPEGHPGEVCAPEAMGALFAYLGQHVKAPVLLNYAENDRWFGRASRRWYEKLRGAGASAQFVLLPPFGADGHFVFTDASGAAAWAPPVAEFLRRHGLPFDRPPVI